MLAGAFLWGATVAAFFSFVLNTIGSYVVGANLGETAAAVYESGHLRAHRGGGRRDRRARPHQRAGRIAGCRRRTG